MIGFEELQISIDGQKAESFFRGSFTLDDAGLIEEIATGDLYLRRGNKNRSIDAIWLFKVLERAIEDAYGEEIADWIASREKRSKDEAADHRIALARSE